MIMLLLGSFVEALTMVLQTPVTVCLAATAVCAFAWITFWTLTRGHK